MTLVSNEKILVQGLETRLGFNTDSGSTWSARAEDGVSITSEIKRAGPPGSLGWGCLKTYFNIQVTSPGQHSVSFSEQIEGKEEPFQTNVIEFDFQG